MPYKFCKIRICSKCGDTNTLFILVKIPNGYKLSNRCKQCVREYYKIRYENKRDILLKQRKDWCDKNRDKIKIKNRRDYLKRKLKGLYL